MTTNSRKIAIVLSLLLASAIGGCNRSPSPGTAYVEQTPEGAVAVRTIDRAGLDKAIEKERGNVVLVDYWATWCSPCKQLFPHTVDLHHRYSDRGFRAMTVSMDTPDSEGSVRKFLLAHQATTENFIAHNGGSDHAFEEFDIDGSIPCLKVYDRHGKLRETIVGNYPDKIDLAVKKLLDEI